jgi:hypothetical protein
VILTAVFATTCVAGASTAADAADGQDVRASAVASKSSHSYGRSRGHHTPPSRGDRGDHYDRHDGRHHPGGHGYRDGHGYGGHHGRDYGRHDYYRGHYRHRGYGHSYSRHYYAPPYPRHYGPYRKHKGYYCEHCHYRASSYTIFYQHVFHHHHVPWYDIGALIVFDPVRLYFVFGGHG